MSIARQREVDVKAGGVGARRPRVFSDLKDGGGKGVRMNVSLFRLVCIGLFLFLVTSVSIAADLPQTTDGKYLVKDSDSDQAIRVDGLTCGDLVIPLLIRWNTSGWVSNNDLVSCKDWVMVSCQQFPDPVANPPEVGLHSQLCDNATATINFEVLAVPPTAGTLLDYSVQDMIVIACAWLSLIGGWIAGLKS